jgi:hypothetical protein
LEYAPTAGVDAARGRLWFRPSRRSLLLLALTVIPIAWLALRHEPWRQTARVDCRPGTLDRAFVTPDNRLLIYDKPVGLQSLDVRTGRTTFITALKPNRFVCYPIDHGRRIAVHELAPDGRRVAVREPGPKVIRVYDMTTGRLTQTLPPVNVEIGTAMSDDGRWIISHDAGGTVSDLSQSTPSGAPIVKRVETRYGLWFGDGGKRLLVVSSDDTLQILGPPDFNPVAELSFPPGWAVLRRDAQRDLGDHFVVGSSPSRNPAGNSLFELRSTRDGHVIDSQTLSGQGNVLWSSDGSIKAVCVPSPGIWYDRVAIDFVDRATGKTIGKVPPAERGEPLFFSHPDRYVATIYTGVHAGTAVYSVKDPRPLAHLDLPPPRRYELQLQIAPDDQTIVVSDTLGHSLFRRTGWDCPESPFGLLAFPHAWTVAVLIAVTALSLRADAARARSTSTVPPPSLLSNLLFAMAVLLTIRFTLEACLGHLVYSGAPVLLLCAIGLVTGARRWRLFTLLALCATLPSYFFYLAQMRGLGLTSTCAFRLFDRLYDVPQAVPFTLLLLTTVGVLAAIIDLSRPRRAVPQ